MELGKELKRLAEIAEEERAAKKEALEKARTTEIDLATLATDIAKRHVMPTSAELKVQTFSIYARNGKIGTQDAYVAVQEKVNKYLSTLVCSQIRDVKFQVVKQFLPQTNIGEYEENWYVMVMYED